MLGVNTKEYWDKRFKTGDWDNNLGEEQSRFFYNIALSLMPQWIKDEINKNYYTLCDIGCAEGDGTHILYREFFNSEIYGYDISEYAIEVAKERYKGIEFIANDIMNLDKNHDVIFSSNTLEHFRRPMDILKKMASVANKYIILMLPLNDENNYSEHFSKFTYNNIPLRVDEFTLVHYDEINTTNMPDTHWTGEQILLIYAHKNEAQQHTLAQLILNKSRESNVLTIQELNNVNQSKQEVIDNLQILNSEKQQHIDDYNYKVNEYITIVENQKQLLSEKEHSIQEKQKTIDEQKARIKSIDEIRDEQVKIINDYEDREHLLLQEIELKENEMMQLKELGKEWKNKAEELNELLYQGNLEKQLFSEQLWKIHQSHFWKVANRYYKLRDKTPIKYPYKCLKKVKHKLIRNKVIESPVVNEIIQNQPIQNQPIQVTQRPKNKSVYIFGGVAYYDIGGGQRSAQLAKTFYKLGYDVYYIFAYDSSEKTKVNIDMPVKAHIHIDALSEAYIKNNINKDTFFIFEIPHIKFNKYIDLGKLFGIKTVYEHIDNWETSLGGDWFDIEVYRNFINKADMLVATAGLLKEKLEETVKDYCDQKDKKVYYLANAVDSELFEALITRECPKDLVRGDKTLIYYGSLWGEWFDWDLVFGLAKHFPSYTINLIGEAEGIKERFKNIPKNVHFLGLKKQVELPAYLEYSDVAILPFKNSDIGKYVSPLKIFEYICMGKVVLSTKLPDIEEYPNVYYGDTPSEWISIMENNPIAEDDFVPFINQNNWYDRCYKIINLLNKDKKVQDKISVIILNRNNKKVIFRCVDSLLTHNKYNYQIIVVDNQSEDGSYEMLEEKYKDRITLIKNNKNGCACGRNLGVSHATGDILVFLDSDQWALSGDWLDNALDILDTQRNIGAVGWAAGWFSPGSVGGPICDYLPNRGVDKNELYRTDIAYLGTGGLVLNKSLFYQIGGFDEQLDPTCYEDTDFTLGIKYLGFDLAYSPYLPIFHLPHQTTHSGSAAHAQLMKKNGDYFKAKWQKRDATLLEVYLNQ